VAQHGTGVVDTILEYEETRFSTHDNKVLKPPQIYKSSLFSHSNTTSSAPIPLHPQLPIPPTLLSTHSIHSQCSSPPFSPSPSSVFSTPQSSPRPNPLPRPTLSPTLTLIPITSPELMRPQSRSEDSEVEVHGTRMICSATSTWIPLPSK
jgi:hypothetical protein